MNLRDQLREILPEILSDNPADSIKGTELIRLVKYRLNQDYSDATLRYHFSIMSCDPSSPIAKVEQGQGYFLRTTTIHSINSARNLLTSRQGVLGERLSPGSDDTDLNLARANKFRAIFIRHNELDQRFPFVFEESFSQGDPKQNLWKYPDALLLDWHVTRLTATGLEINPTLLEVCQHTGSPPFSLTAVKMKLDLEMGSLRETFFQCLSNSLWANAGELVVASPLTDEKLVEDLRALGTAFQVGITSYRLSPAMLDDFPEAAAIRTLKTREFEAIESQIFPQRVTAGRQRTPLSWFQLREVCQENSEFEELFAWLSRCISDRKPYRWQDFRTHTVRRQPSETGAELLA